MQNQTNLLVFKFLIFPVSQLLSHFIPAIEVVSMSNRSCEEDYNHSQEH